MKPDGPVFDTAWRARCRVVPYDRELIEGMIRTHYLHKWPGVVVLRLVMFCDNDPVGCIVYALPPRETAKRYGGVTWELARLWVADRIPRNVETWLIAQSVGYIKTYFPDVRSLVSYADPSAGHAGTIYKAANWRDDGRTDQERKTPRFDYVHPVTGKRYSRRSHVPPDVAPVRVPRVSKHRFVLGLQP